MMRDTGLLRLRVLMGMSTVLEGSSNVLWYYDIEELELFTNWQILDHVVLYQHL